VKISANSGFTLIELIVVVMLLGVGAAVAAPSFISYRQNANLREAASDLASDISLYRQKAVAENRRYRIIFDQPGNSYSVQREILNNPGNYEALVPAVTKSPGDISSNVIISDITYPGLQITIQPRGTIQPAGSVTLQHTISSLTKQTTTNLMGRVHID
jgi:type II secretion system protein H